MNYPHRLTNLSFPSQFEVTNRSVSLHCNHLSKYISQCHVTQAGTYLTVTDACQGVMLRKMQTMNIPPPLPSLSRQISRHSDYDH